MEELGDAVASLQYMVARPGTFLSFYPETTDDMCLAVLVDGFAEAQLDGLLLDYAVDEDGLLTPALSSGQAALVTLYGGLRFLRAELINRSTSVSYKAGTASYETTQATNILRDIMKALQLQKDRITAALSDLTSGGGSAFYMADQYAARAWDPGYRYSNYALMGW